MKYETVKQIRKLYYSISEVSRMTGLASHVLRYWESEFEELNPKKNRAGNRIYTEKDIEVVLRLQELLRREKYTIEGAKQRLKSGRRHKQVDPVKRELIDLRAFLLDLEEKL